jgi:hypothetical protein
MKQLKTVFGVSLKRKIYEPMAVLQPYLKSTKVKYIAETVLFAELNYRTMCYDWIEGRYTIARFATERAGYRYTKRLCAADRAFLRLYARLIKLVHDKLNMPKSKNSQYVESDRMKLVLAQAERYVNYLKKWQKRQQNQTSSLS